MHSSGNPVLVKTVYVKWLESYKRIIFKDCLLSFFYLFTDNTIEVIYLTSIIPEIQARTADQPASNKQSLNTNSTNLFEDYVMNAFKAKKKKQDLNPLYENLSAIGTSSALATLLGNSPNNAPLISSYLNSAGPNPSYFDEQAMQNTYSNYLQRNFHAKQMDILIEAKQNLSTKMTDYKASVCESPSKAEELRLQQMTDNVEIVDQFVTKSKNEQAVKDAFLQQMNQSSAYAQYLLFKSNK